MAQWNSEQYLKFATQRTRPAADLAEHIAVQNPAKILDVGCGPGNSTAVLTQLYPNADILGIDNSEEMIEAARKAHPSLRFELFDASTDLAPLGSGYDVVFSNAAIQWIPNHSKLLPALVALLRRGGQLAVQTPVQQSQPIHKIIEEVAAQRQWAHLFSGTRHFYNLTAEEYFDVLYPLTTEVDLWQTTYLHVLQSHSDMLEWYRGTGLRPYLQALPTYQQPLFEMELLQRITAAYPLQAGGKVLFPFPRLFFVATAL